jgi:hypothetical protein
MTFQVGFTGIGSDGRQSIHEINFLDFVHVLRMMRYHGKTLINAGDKPRVEIYSQFASIEPEKYY